MATLVSKILELRAETPLFMPPDRLPAHRRSPTSTSESTGVERRIFCGSLSTAEFRLRDLWRHMVTRTWDLLEAERGFSRPFMLTESLTPLPGPFQIRRPSEAFL